MDATRKLDIYVPHFCYHRKLSIAANCRMCLVEIEKQPKLQIACNTTVTEGMVVHTKSERAKEAQRAQAMIASLIDAMPDGVSFAEGRPGIRARDGKTTAYDLLVAAVGVNSPVLASFEALGIGYERPGVTKTFIREYRLGQEVISASLDWSARSSFGFSRTTKAISTPCWSTTVTASPATSFPRWSKRAARPPL